jgi:hypothetical protein
MKLTKYKQIVLIFNICSLFLRKRELQWFSIGVVYQNLTTTVLNSECSTTQKWSALLNSQSYNLFKMMMPLPSQIRPELAVTYLTTAFSLQPLTTKNPVQC